VASLADLLVLYDHDERFAATAPDIRREEMGDLVRIVDRVTSSGSVIYTRLDETSVDAAIDEQVAYFGGLGLEFEWKAYAHDLPSDLVERLARHGFAIDEPEAILVLDLNAGQPAGSSQSLVQIKRIEDPAELEAVAAIRRQVYGGDPTDHIRRLQMEMEHEPTYISVYVAYVDNAPAAAGWTRFPRDSAFASMWGGSTVPALRGRGIYRALVAARVAEARQRRVKYLTVDARSTSRPILERLGFQRLTTATPCTWSPPQAQ
jgi:GNAT superfamily N-acetyltransferase